MTPPDLGASAPASPEAAPAWPDLGDGAAAEPEPLLSYAAFGSDVPGILARDAATCLRVSDKLLALGTRSGAVHLLDYEGNKVQTFREHTAAVTDISFDADAETLASASADGHLALCSLYCGAASRLRCRGPATAVALDPRHAHRKTKDVYYGTAGGALLLCSRGWLGAVETVLFQGRGTVKAAQAAGTMLAWVTDSGLRVYDTSDHSRVGKIGRPGSARPGSAGGGGDGGGGGSGGGSGSPCSLEWVGDRELLMGWGRHVAAVAVVPALSAGDGSGSTEAPTPPPATPPTPSGSAAPAATTSQRFRLQVVAEFEVRAEQGSGSSGEEPAAAAAPDADASEASGSTTPPEPPSTTTAAVAVLGVAPFGRDLAVLTRISSGGAPTPRIQLRVYDRAGTLLSSDDVDLGESGGAEKNAGRVTLAAFYSLADVIPAPKDAIFASAVSSDATFGVSSYLAPDLLINRGRAFLGLSTQGEEPGAVVPAAGAPPVTPPRAARAPPTATRRFQWWSDGAEPIYFVVSSDAVAVGRPRSAADRIAWLAQRARFDEALEIAENDPSVKRPARLKLGERYLRHLCEAGRHDAAAELCPRVLGADASAWERWVYTFGQEAQLPALAPHLPTGPPASVLLSPSTYDLTLAACLRGAAGHDALRELVDALPVGSYDAAALLNLVGQRLRPATAGGTPQAPPPVLRRVAAALHGQLGQHEAALGLLLGLRSGTAFDYVREHGLYAAAARAAGDLIELDEVRATALLVEAAEEALPHAVVASLQARIDAASGGDGIAAPSTTTAPAADSGNSEPDERSRWSLRLYHYLDWLCQRDTGAAAPFAALYVDLCAAHDPSRLLALLSSSSAYPLDAALEACEARGLVRESVYVLGRMGSADAALRLIVGRLRDVAGAVAFVRESRDDELWELLISLTLGDAALAGELLDHAGAGGADPRRLVAAIPDALAIERLRDRLVAVVADFRAALALQAGCNAVLRGDCAELGDRLYCRLRRALGRLHLLRPGGRWEVYEALVGPRIGAPEAAELESSHGVESGAAARAAEAAWAAGQGGPRVWIGAVGSPPGRRTLSSPVSVRSSPSKFPPGRRRGARAAA